MYISARWNSFPMPAPSRKATPVIPNMRQNMAECTLYVHGGGLLFRGESKGNVLLLDGFPRKLVLRIFQTQMRLFEKKFDLLYSW